MESTTPTHGPALGKHSSEAPSWSPEQGRDVLLTHTDRPGAPEERWAVPGAQTATQAWVPAQAPVLPLPTESKTLKPPTSQRLDRTDHSRINASNSFSKIKM